jgi:hypothetical protein
MIYLIEYQGIRGYKLKYFTCEVLNRVGRVIGYEDYDIYLGKQVIKFIDEKDEKIHRKKPGFNEELGIEQLDIVSKKKITNSSNIKLYDDQNNILMENIKWFYETCKKCDNDIVNKIREKIIEEIFNLHDDYFNNEFWGSKWIDIKEKLFNIMKQLYYKHTGNNILDNITYTVKSKGGRGNNYDFEIIYSDGINAKLEFKYGSDIFSYAQFLSLYWNNINLVKENYIKYWYDNYLKPYLESLDIDTSNIIDFEEYNKHVYDTGYKHVLFSKIREELKKRKTSTSEYNKINHVSIKEFLNSFMNKDTINKVNLQNRMNEQKSKIFLFCNGGEFNLEKISDHMDLDMDKEIKITHNTIILTTTSNKKIRCLLRWKNGNGCVGPAWQIALRHK